MLSIASKRLFNNQKNSPNNLKMRRNTISRSKILKKEYKSKETKMFFVNMLAELTERLTLNNYQTSRIRVHLEYQNPVTPNLRFSINLINPTNHYSKLLKTILPIYVSKVNQQEQITKIGIAFEKLTPIKNQERFSFFKRIPLYKKIYQN